MFVAEAVFEADAPLLAGCMARKQLFGRSWMPLTAEAHLAFAAGRAFWRARLAATAGVSGRSWLVRRCSSASSARIVESGAFAVAEAAGRALTAGRAFAVAEAEAIVVIVNRVRSANFESK